MTRLILAIMVVNTGCLHVRPVGPLADALPARTPAVREPGVPEPVIRQTGRPTPPSLYVTPAEITGANAADAARRLQQELDTDNRSLEAMPRYSEVSQVK